MAQAAAIVMPVLWLDIYSPFTRETRETAIVRYRENYFPACRLIFNWSDFSHPFPLAIAHLEPSFLIPY